MRSLKTVQRRLEKAEATATAKSRCMTLVFRSSDLNGQPLPYASTKAGATVDEAEWVKAEGETEQQFEQRIEGDLPDPSEYIWITFSGHADNAYIEAKGDTAKAVKGCGLVGLTWQRVEGEADQDWIRRIQADLEANRPPFSCTRRAVWWRQASNDGGPEPEFELIAKHEP